MRVHTFKHRDLIEEHYNRENKMVMRNKAYTITLVLFLYGLFFLSEAEGATENPYYFGQGSFQTGFNDTEGLEKALPMFTSPQLQGIEKYLFAFMESSPMTFAVPRHPDATIVFFVLTGSGVIGFVSEEGKASYKLERGYVGRVPASTTHYVVSSHPSDPLRLVIIFVPLNLPGSFQKFFPSASINQSSYFSGFSSDVLSTSLNISKSLVDLLQRGQRPEQKVIRTITPDEVKELSRDAISPEHNPHQRTLWSPFNLFSQKPIYSNVFGRFYEAKPEKFIQLQDLGISVVYFNMTQGTIFVPHFSTTAITIVYVEKGCARFELATPQAVVSLVCKGEAFVVLAGYPVAVISQTQNFAAVGFGVNVNSNVRTFLAGQGNVLSKLDTVVKRLMYGVGDEVAMKLFTSQNYSYFVPTVQP